jgi:ABC-2 type transport system permease protein
MFARTGEQRKIALVDATGRLGEPLQKSLDRSKLKDGRPEFLVETVALSGSVDETRRKLEPRATSGELFGIVTVGDDLNAKGNFRFDGRNVGNIRVLEQISGALRDAVIGLRVERANLPITREQVDRLVAPLGFETFQVTKEGGTKKKGFEQAYFGTFIFVMILYMSLLLYGIAVMRGILEEKSNRVMEVLLGSLSPDQLMTGKIIGIGLVGLTQMAVYAATAGVVRVYIAANQVEGDWTAMLDAFSPVKMFYFVVFFVLGYFMFTALFAAVGAVCNSEQEAQNLQTPLVMCLVVPMLATLFFVGNPDSTVAVVVSLIPIFTPMVMFMRISVLTPPLWQILLSVVLLLATIWVFFKGVAKIFRVGILMYGKRPTIPEILRWARR